MNQVLVLGIGNILMGDDAAGVRVAEAVQSGPRPSGVDVVIGECAGLDLVDEIAGRRRIVVVDAMDHGGLPGTIFRLAGGELGGADAAGRTLSQHEFGLTAVLEMARRLECAPAEVVVIGIQPARVGFSLEMSPEVAAAIPAAARLVLAEAGRPVA